MSSYRVTFALALFLGIAGPGLRAGTHYLMPTNPGAEPPYATWETAGTSVVDVVNAAVAGSEPRTVWITNGTYALTSAVPAISAAIAIRSVNGPEKTVISGDGQYRGFELNHTAIVLDGLTLSNGYAANGGGIRMRGGLVTNCIVTDCTVTSGGEQDQGGGIMTEGGPNVIVNSTIRRNLSLTRGGGGLYLRANSTNLIQHCRIEGNACAHSGGGFNMGYGSNPFEARILNCVIRHNYNTTSNTGYYGGGLYLTGSNLLVANCTIVSNWAGMGGGIAFVGNVEMTNTVANCIIASNEYGATWQPVRFKDIRKASGTATFTNAIAWSCSPLANDVFVLDDGRGNTISDPEFAAFAQGDYRLASGSPCINAGTNQQDWMSGAVDFGGRTRIDPFSGRVDMGAHEYIGAGSMIRLR